MKLALIAHGSKTIPPPDWGAVEGTIWNRKVYLERLGHRVDVFNTRAFHTVLHQINSGSYDFAHCHNEMFVLDCVAHLRVPFAVTSHTGVSKGISGNYEYRGATDYLFKDTLQAPANIVLSEQIKATYERAGYSGLLRVLPNGAEVEMFKVATYGNGRAICLGRISSRKNQAWLSDIVRDRLHVDFVGPWDRSKEPAFVEHEMAHYLGVWDRSTVHKRLTDYSCLVLLSKSEGAVKVVPEALAAGLSVVISEACAANLTHEDFITVIPDGEKRPEAIALAIQTSIDKNASLRHEIRSYAQERFDYAVLCQNYLRIIDEVREFFSTGPSLALPQSQSSIEAISAQRDAAAPQCSFADRLWRWSRTWRRLLRSLTKLVKTRVRASSRKFRFAKPRKRARHW